MRNIKLGTFRALAAAAVLFAVPLSTVSASGIGAEIGAAIPMGGTSTTISGDSENYAMIHCDGLLIEARAMEEKGSLSMEMKLTNERDAAFVVDHRDGQCYDFVISDAKGNVLYRWSAQMAFTQALTSSSIPAKGSVTYTAEISRRDYKKIKDKAEFIQMELTDTDYWFSLRVPKKETSHTSSPITLHGSIEIGNGNHGW